MALSHEQVGSKIPPKINTYSLTRAETQECAKGGGGHWPPQILADQRAPPAAAARRITTCPPRFLDFGPCLDSGHTVGFKVF